MILGSLIGLFAALGINFFVQQIPEGSEEEFIANLIQSQEGIIEQLAVDFLPAFGLPSDWQSPGLRD